MNSVGSALALAVLIIPAAISSFTPTTMPMSTLLLPLLTNIRMSDTRDGQEVVSFPEGTSLVYVVFDYAQMDNTVVRVRIYDNWGNVLFDQCRVYTGEGTGSVGVSSSGDAFPNSRYLTNLYVDGAWIKSLMWEVGGPFTPEPTPTTTPTATPTPTGTPVPPGTKFTYLPLVTKSFITPPLWRTPVKVSDTPGRSSSPVMAIDRGGGIHLVWIGESEDRRNCKIYYCQGNGVAWASTVDVSQWLANSVYPDIAIDDEGQVHVVWAEHLGEAFEIYYSQGDRISWSEPMNVSHTSTRSESPAIAIDSNGIVHLVWAETSICGRKQIHYSWWNGIVWSPPINLSGDKGSSSMPDIITDETDLIHVVWSNDSGRSDIYYSNGNNGFWSTPMNISQTSGNSTKPKVTIDSQGGIHIAWSEETFEPYPSDFKIYYVEGDGSTWSSPIVISDPTRSHSGPAIDTDSENNVHVLWMSGEGVSYVVRKGAVWSQPASIPPSPVGWSGSATLAVDGDDDVHAAWAASYQPYSPRYIYYSSTKLAH